MPFLLAIIASHNVIIVHNQLIRFPDIAFFTSPIPLHISAMVILFGRMSGREELSHSTAVEDIWLALDMLPRFRWRWERKDVNGGHPLIARLAERVLNVDLHTIKPSTPPMLLCEPDWTEDIKSPHAKSQHTTPTISSATHGAYPGNGVNGHNPQYGPHPRMHRNNNGGGGSSQGSSTPPDNLAEIPEQLFYPFYPEQQPPAGANAAASGHQQDYSHLLAAAAQHDRSYGPQQDSFMATERDPMPAHPHGMQMWMNGVSCQPIQVPFT